ncbi:MAG TPA: hypothetical protein PLA03_12120, partial [Acidobacteriota bacterium]|nr:hypothetical protein [Acidobacteriota bacterium]
RRNGDYLALDNDRLMGDPASTLRDQPQLLEKLGILKRGGKTAAQRKAPQKAAATRASKKTPKA